MEKYGQKWKVVPLDKLENVTEWFCVSALLEEVDEVCTFSEPMTTKQKKRRKSGSDKGDLSNYWHQRYSYFSKIDDGCLIDTVGWYSVTPELIARHIASRVPVGATVLDGFCGVGGNAIAFALRGCKVIAVELDKERLKLAVNNARVYGVEKNIKFIHGDYFKVVEKLVRKETQVDVVFLSPPWGGPDYAQEDVFRLEAMLIDEKDPFDYARQLTQNVIYYVPRNTSIYDLAQLSVVEKEGEDEFCVEQHWLNDRFKAMSIYYGKTDFYQ